MPWLLQAQKQIHLASCLDKLMTDVQRNLEAKNRDKFTQVCSSVDFTAFQLTLLHTASEGLRLAFTHAEFDHSAA